MSSICIASYFATKLGHRLTVHACWVCINVRKRLCAISRGVRLLLPVPHGPRADGRNEARLLSQRLWIVPSFWSSDIWTIILLCSNSLWAIILSKRGTAFGTICGLICGLCNSMPGIEVCCGRRRLHSLWMRQRVLLVCRLMLLKRRLHVAMRKVWGRPVGGRGGGSCVCMELVGSVVIRQLISMLLHRRMGGRGNVTSQRRLVFLLAFGCQIHLLRSVFG